MHRFAPAGLATLLLCAATLQAQADLPALPEDRAQGAESIQADSLRVWLTHLASPELAGRATGFPGHLAAAEYLRDHFEALGLEPGNGDSYFQNLPWKHRSADPERSGLVLRLGEDQIWSLNLAHGLYGATSVDSSFSGPLCLVSCADGDGDGLEELDLDGCAVLIWPRGGLLGELAEDYHRFAGHLARRSFARLTAKVRAAGGTLIAVVDDHARELLGPAQPTSYPDSGGRASAARDRRPNAFVLSQEQFAALRQAATLELPLVGDTPTVVRSEAVLSSAVMMRIEDVQAPNVLAVLPGSDPNLAEEYVAVGCHLDHLGAPNGEIHPGADDDGSGSAGLMAIAAAFADNPTRPKRSVIFLAFCGEERGLLGSAYYVDHPTVPLESIIAELQVDMIGRSEENERRGERADDNRNSLHLVGSLKLSAELDELCRRLNQRAGFELEDDEEQVFFRSDHFNFARQGIPAAFLFTGFHPDYHQPTDTVDKIDFDKLARVATYVYDLAFELAQTEQRPRVDPKRWAGLERKDPRRREPVAPLRAD